MPRSALLIGLLFVLPGAVGLLCAGAFGAATIVIGTFAGFLGAFSCGWQRARRHVPVVGVAVALGALTGGTWWWVLLVTVLGAVAGYSSRWGLMPIYGLALVFAITAPTIEHATSGTDALTWARLLTGIALVVVGGMFGTELARRAGLASTLSTEEEKPGSAAILGVVTALALAVSAAIAVTSTVDHAYWLPMTVAIVVMPSSQGRFKRGRDRLVGTLVGLAVTLPLAWVHPPRAASLVLAYVCLLVLLSITGPYWLQITFGTAMLLLVVAPDTTVQTAGDRALLTAAGVVVLAISAAIVITLSPHRNTVASAPGDAATG